MRPTWRRVLCVVATALLLDPGFASADLDSRFFGVVYPLTPSYSSSDPKVEAVAAALNRPCDTKEFVAWPAGNSAPILWLTLNKSLRPNYRVDPATLPPQVAKSADAVFTGDKRLATGKLTMVWWTTIGAVALGICADNAAIATTPRNWLDNLPPGHPSTPILIMKETETPVSYPQNSSKSFKTMQFEFNTDAK